MIISVRGSQINLTQSAQEMPTCTAICMWNQGMHNLFLLTLVLFLFHSDTRPYIDCKNRKHTCISIPILLLWDYVHICSMRFISLVCLCMCKYQYRMLRRSCLSTFEAYRNERLWNIRSCLVWIETGNSALYHTRIVLIIHLSHYIIS